MLVIHHIIFTIIKPELLHLLDRVIKIFSQLFMKFYKSITAERPKNKLRNTKH